MLKADSCGHNSLRSDKCPLFSNAFSREPRGSQSPWNQAPESESIPALCSGGSRERIEKRTAGSDTPSESAVLFYLCVIIQFDDN